jgi:RNA polymerase sigma factor (TIGR02999 family)
MLSTSHTITDLLTKWSNGDTTALEELIPIVYPELQRLARAYMRREAPDHTLQTSALVNEAFLRLVDRVGVDWQDRAHFFAVTAQIMRHILVDHARRHAYAKRGGGALHLELDEVALTATRLASEFVALDDALNTLARIDERKSKIVELKFFGGLTVDEIAEVMKLAPITIKREWRVAKAWLHLEIRGGEQQDAAE